MTKAVVCRICLRTDVGARDISQSLVEFHDDICDYEVYANKSLKYCPICEYKLKKFYNFKQQCLRSHKVLKTWKRTKKEIPENLHEHLQPSTIGMCTATSRHKVFEFLQHNLKSFESRNPSESYQSESFNQSELFVKTESEDTNTHYIFLTKDVKVQNNETQNKLSTETQNNKSIDVQIDDLEQAFEDVQKNEFEFEDVLQKNELIEDLSTNILDLPISDLKQENEKDFDYLDTDFDDNDDEYTLEDFKKKKKAKIKKIKIKPRKVNKTDSLDIKCEDIDDISLSELLKCDDKTIKLRQKFLKNKAMLRDRIIEILDSGQFNDLGDNITMNKELFLKIFHKYDETDMRMPAKPDSPELVQKLKKFLLNLLKKYNPEYDAVFDIEYLNTDDQKLSEFNRRRDMKGYIEAPYKCELCFKGFDAESHLEYHNKWHKPNPNDIVCNICPMRFISKSTYKAHRKNNHTVVYSCKLCSVVTYHFSVMINHYNQHKGVEYSCPTCLSVYTNKTTLNNHRREAHATSHICTSCARSFVSEKGLFFHRKYKHRDEAQANPGEAATCVECNITFDSQKVYLKHERSSHTRRPETVYKCYFCKDGFDSIEALRKHKLELNHQRAPKQLIHRTSIHKPKGARKTRRARVSDPDKPTRKCPVCLLEIPNSFPTSLYMHYLEAHPDVPYASIYTDTKDYLCEQCGKTFRVYCHYLDHKNQHTGAKPYACKECPSRFATRKHLTYHSERHRPPRYQCKQCGKLFLSAANLFAHRRGHIGDRRFKCEICFKGFLHSYTLKEHVKGVHNQIRRVRKTPHRDKIV